MLFRIAAAVAKKKKAFPTEHDQKQGDRFPKRVVYDRYSRLIKCVVHHHFETRSNEMQNDVPQTPFGLIVHTFGTRKCFITVKEQSIKRLTSLVRCLSGRTRFIVNSVEKKRTKWYIYIQCPEIELGEFSSFRF